MLIKILQLAFKYKTVFSMVGISLYLRARQSIRGFTVDKKNPLNSMTGSHF